MNLFLIQSVVLCTIFTLFVTKSIIEDPIASILNYPNKIRERVESIPEYKSSINKIEKEHFSEKIVAIFIVIALSTILIWFSQKRTFVDAFLYGFALFTVVNLWDLVVIDWVWFAHSKKVRIPGTEDMDKEYRDYIFHLFGFFKGTLIGFAISLISSGLIVVVNFILYK